MEMAMDDNLIRKWRIEVVTDIPFEMFKDLNREFIQMVYESILTDDLLDLEIDLTESAKAQDEDALLWIQKAMILRNWMIPELHRIKDTLRKSGYTSFINAFENTKGSSLVLSRGVLRNGITERVVLK
jgi:hypothetical protein